MKFSLSQIHDKFLLWRAEHVKERTFLLFVCFLVGIAASLAAFLLKRAVFGFKLFSLTISQPRAPIISICSILR